VSQHPIRVVVTDDLERSRLTVFFRLLLAIPHFLWAGLWGIAAIVAVIVSWFATLARGQTPDALHVFLALYVRYLTHLSAYVLLAANPYPAFTGSSPYPVDVEIDPPAPQHRGKTAARIVLAVPALLLSESLIGFGGARAWRGHGGGSSFQYSQSGAATVVAILAWFACLALARMPRGFRDLQTYSIRYVAQAWAYVLLLTDRYPDARPAEPPAGAPDAPHPVAVAITDDLVRGRLTVFFRILLALPHLIWILLWLVTLVPVLVACWVATLVSGRLPASLHRFLCAYLRYQAHLTAFVYLVANPFPGFTGSPGYPIDLDLPRAPEPQSRWRTAVRLLLALPALIVAAGLGGAAVVAAVLGWFASLATGRMPRGLRDLGAWSIRYGGQADAYLFFVTERYAYAGPYEFAEPPPEEELADQYAAA
jgi:Domain of unknown function (DUF4389)